METEHALAFLIAHPAASRADGGSSTGAQNGLPCRPLPERDLPAAATASKTSNAPALLGAGAGPPGLRAAPPPRAGEGLSVAPSAHDRALGHGRSPRRGRPPD